MSKIQTTVTETLVSVKAWPDEVSIDIDLRRQSGNLTIKQAKKLAKLLLEAAAQAKTLDWAEDSKGDLQVVGR